MGFSKKKELKELLDIVYKYSKNSEDLICIACSIHDEDIEEFTNLLKKRDIKDFNDIVEVLTDFRTIKKYKSDDLE